ncbi:1,6-anhydro-N-acetylmuramyl-L-alanine amidase AmpD [Curvibacter sp. APW13]|uniref:1,6-anhydro-N-acetylmuramyl-L-alanine amidase AmpD n=1 Tax=Curvibacter sp. APW13 TaxID=3077236 RepID=UPI0028DE38BA|nr:1,6-anhydro-N-acetylmuramyl-L-alanine amidase AmpD [Curvibacter sp. APW13]MDT8989769.1 1,6-anhydro-N-acetylmuramyl-L-alanine amidase AmpD [Curvibacter sp. APW13]
MGTEREAPPRSVAGTAWLRGWYSLAFHLPSPNFGKRPGNAHIDLVIIHSISLPPGQFGTGHVQALFSNTIDWDAHPYLQTIRGLKVSSHFFIARNGSLWQFVDCDARAWHAGASHYRGRDNCNDDSIGIELEGLEGQSFALPQYQRLEHLLSDLRQRYPLTYIAGHEHVAPGRKQDPGPGFDWHYLRTSRSTQGLAFPAA